jgi:hypothetical protein
MQSMRSIVFFISSISLCIWSYIYANEQLAEDGEYHASHYIINEYVTHFRIATNVKGNRFVTHTYLSSPSLNETASFITEGVFLDDNKNGGYATEYIMRQDNKPKVVDQNLADAYINMTSRVGMVVGDDIETLYHSKDFNVIDMGRNNNIIMFSKRH